MTETFSVQETDFFDSFGNEFDEEGEEEEKSMTLRDSIFPLIFPFSHRRVTMINEAGGENVFPRRYFSFRRVFIAFKQLTFSSFVARRRFEKTFLVYC